jgi:hypothetical protein
MWFSATDIHTEALDKLKEDQMPKPAKEMRAVLEQLFLSFPALEYIISVKVLKQLVPILRPMTNDTIHNLQKTYFGVESVIDPDGVCRTKYIKIPYYEVQQEGKDEGNDEGVSIKYHKDKAKGFRFLAERFLAPNDYEYVRKVALGLTAPPDAPSDVTSDNDKSHE